MKSIIVIFRIKNISCLFGIIYDNRIQKREKE